jgi:hypothetical protein
MKKIRVENNEVVECMNADEVPEGGLNAGDWRDAVEILPQLVAGKQITNGHWFDLSKTPVEIRWNVADLSVEDRKQPLYYRLDEKYKAILKPITESANDVSESTQAFLQAMLDKQADKAAIDALQTHEEVDTYIQNNL